jgi:ribosome recycling factor
MSSTDQIQAAGQQAFTKAVQEANTGLMKLYDGHINTDQLNTEVNQRDARTLTVDMFEDNMADAIKQVLLGTGLRGGDNRDGTMAFYAPALSE